MNKENRLAVARAGLLTAAVLSGIAAFEVGPRHGEDMPRVAANARTIFLSNPRGDMAKAEEQLRLEDCRRWLAGEVQAVQPTPLTSGDKVLTVLKQEKTRECQSK